MGRGVLAVWPVPAMLSPPCKTPAPPACPQEGEQLLTRSCRGQPQGALLQPCVPGPQKSAISLEGIHFLATRTGGQCLPVGYML